MPPDIILRVPSCCQERKTARVSSISRSVDSSCAKMRDVRHGIRCKTLSSKAKSWQAALRCDLIFVAWRPRRVKYCFTLTNLYAEAIDTPARRDGLIARQERLDFLISREISNVTAPKHEYHLFAKTARYWKKVPCNDAFNLNSRLFNFSFLVFLENHFPSSRRVFARVKRSWWSIVKESVSHRSVTRRFLTHFISRKQRRDEFEFHIFTRLNGDAIRRISIANRPRRTRTHVCTRVHVCTRARQFDV